MSARARLESKVVYAARRLLGTVDDSTETVLRGERAGMTRLEVQSVELRRLRAHLDALDAFDDAEQETAAADAGSKS